ncbi:MAG: DNA mismatch repair endonuclease MutL [Clostridiales bacterium]|nr:DNA mismatch repair endonuclease MutL [Clostridiales bacterium]
MEYRPIRKLSEEVIGQIAAGEVVERPASVVKELVENSIDAGASAVTVELREGGLQSIRVSDNGRGIPAGQVRMAFERHATSKLETAEELFDVHTLGFRGEALASVAAVAKVGCTTRAADAEFGVRAEVEAGVIRSVEEAASPVGTSIVVRDLFYNAPVRLRFLKKPVAEAALVSDYMLRLILSRPDVAFRFVNQGKTVYRSAGDGTLESALYCVYGREALRDMRRVRGAAYGVLVDGYVGVGDQARGNRQQQSFFINGRYFRSEGVSRALEIGCDGYVMIGRFPVCALSLQLPYRQVDVNVHPNKLEVRFQHPEAVASAVEELTREALHDVTFRDKLLGRSSNLPETEAPAVRVVELGNNPPGETPDRSAELPAAEPSAAAQPDAARPAIDSSPAQQAVSEAGTPHLREALPYAYRIADGIPGAVQPPPAGKSAGLLWPAGNSEAVPAEKSAVADFARRKSADAAWMPDGRKSDAKQAADAPAGGFGPPQTARWGETPSPGTTAPDFTVSERPGDGEAPEPFGHSNPVTQTTGPEPQMGNPWAENAGTPADAGAWNPTKATETAGGLSTADRRPQGSGARPSAPERAATAPITHEQSSMEELDALSTLRYIGSAFKTYLLFEAGDRLLIVDQHAAHERVLFDRFMARYQGADASQQLLTPRMVRLTARDVMLLNEMGETLTDAGFEIEPFDATTVAVRAIPIILGAETPAKELLLDVLDEAQTQRGRLTQERLRRRVAQMACKHAVKAGDALTPEEVTGLLEQMLRTGAQPTCPHGRPVVTELARRELDKRFKRIP